MNSSQSYFYARLQPDPTRPTSNTGSKSDRVKQAEPEVAVLALNFGITPSKCRCPMHSIKFGMFFLFLVLLPHKWSECKPIASSAPTHKSTDMSTLKYWTCSDIVIMWLVFQQQYSVQHQYQASSAEILLLLLPKQLQNLSSMLKWITDVQFKLRFVNWQHWMRYIQMKFSTETVCTRHTAINIATSIISCAKTKALLKSLWTKENSTVKYRLLLLPQNIDFLLQQYEDKQK